MPLRTAAICLRSLKCTSPDSLNSADDSFSRRKGSHTMVLHSLSIVQGCNTDTVRHTRWLWLCLSRRSYHKSCCTHLRHCFLYVAPSFVLYKKGRELVIRCNTVSRAASTDCVAAGTKLPALQRLCSSSFQSYVQVWLGRSGSRWRGNS